MAPFTFTIRRAPVELTCEVDSIAEAIGILQAEDTTVRTLIATADDLNGSNGEANAAPTGDVPGEPAKEPKARKPRGSSKNKGDPAAAAAPAPIEVAPAAPAAAPDPAKVVALAAQNAAAAATGDVPDFLKNQGSAAPAAAPPPPPPPPPPAIPAAPPSGVLAGKVIAELDKRKNGDDATGAALAGWLAQCGLVKAGSSYDDSIAAVRMLDDAKVSVIAGQLDVA